MSTPSVGFIVGGRVARILLGGWSRAGVLPPEVLVSDSDAGVLDHLANRHPAIRRLVAGVIPNAPSIVNAGFNPVAFSTELPPQDRERVLALLKPLGQSPVGEESKLEAYAIVSGMGPTDLWPQLVELETPAMRCGLSEPEARSALREMVLGTMETLHRSGLEPREVKDLIPVKPRADATASLQEAYRTRLTALIEKIRRQ